MNRVASAIFIVGIAFLMNAATAASVPSDLSYQGRLTDPAGTPLTGTFGMRFNIYDTESGGTPLSSENHQVNVVNGLFTTTIAVWDRNITDGRALWLGIAVGVDGEMTPRRSIQAVPYAFGLMPWAVGASFTTNLVGNELEDPAAVTVSTGLDHNTGISVLTQGADSDGVRSETSSYTSWAFYALTHGLGSYGMYIDTRGPDSHGVDSNTVGVGSHGVYGGAGGPQSYGVYGKSVQSIGVLGEAVSSAGVKGESQGGDGVDGISVNGYGVYGFSTNNNGVFGTSSRGRYGFYTPNAVFAHNGYEAPASDVAEYMPVAENVSAGTVLVIGEDSRLEPSTLASDSRVAGIVSTAPGLSLGFEEGGNLGEAPVAITGVVPCNVDASTGAIRPGDLLCTSNTPGCAMKAVDPKIGTVLGKAMGTLESGRGTIDVLVALQ